MSHKYKAYRLIDKEKTCLLGSLECYRYVYFKNKIQILAEVVPSRTLFLSDKEAKCLKFLKLMKLENLI